MPDRLDRIHLAIRRSYWLSRLVVATRALLVTGFIPTGLVKLLGERFTRISTESPIGFFFEALYQTGLYWQFLGLSQIVAALLLLSRHTAALGALLFLAIIANIFVITLSMDFHGTPTITGLMLLAALFLVAWDFHRWKRLVFTSPGVKPPPLPALRWRGLERALVITGGTAGLGFFLGTRGFVASWPSITCIGVAGLSALLLGIVWIAQDMDRRRRPSTPA